MAICRGLAIDPALKAFLLEGKQAAASQEFFDLLSTFDDQAKVFDILNLTFRGARESFRKYPKLALAIATAGCLKTRQGVKPGRLTVEFIDPLKTPPHRVALAVPGDHNVRNSLAAICIGLDLGISFDHIAEGLAAFDGIARRLEVRSETEDLVVIDDYAHHPTELAATIPAVKTWHPSRRLVAIFQPHRYSRTRDLGPEFGPPLAAADKLVLTAIYPAGEEPIPGVSSVTIAESVVTAGGERPQIADSWEDAVDLILPEIRPGDVVLTMGAGDVWKAGDLLAARRAASLAGNDPAPAALGKAT